ncbi:hypothetical protein ACFE04_008036 [Oxalis oulophora]
MKQKTKTKTTNEYEYEYEYEYDDGDSLIPGLPHDIALDCLTRVPLQSHSDMKLVCHSWRQLLSRRSYFYQQRRKFNKSGQLIFLVQSSLSTETPLTSSPVTTTTITKPVPLQQRAVQQVSVFNGTDHSWHTLTLTDVTITIPLFSHCVTLTSLNKVMLLGGWDPISFDPVPYPYIIDLVTGHCKRGASMLTPRSFFACGSSSVVGGNSTSFIYVAGGHDASKNALKSAEVYDVAADEWRMLPDMEEERDECHGLSWDDHGKFWVVSGYGTDNQGKFRSDAEYFDISLGFWTKIDNVWPFEDISPRSGTMTLRDKVGRCQWWWLFEDHHQSRDNDQQHHHQSGGTMKEFDDKEMKWKVVGSIILPESIVGKKCLPCVSNFGDDKVFVMNGGCDESKDGMRGLVLMDQDGGGVINVELPVGFSGFPYSACSIVV